MNKPAKIDAERGGMAKVNNKNEKGAITTDATEVIIRKAYNTLLSKD